MSTLTEAAAACCACLRVHWVETKHEDGTYSGRWLCTQCGAEFIPPAGLRADMETAANVTAQLQAELEAERHLGEVSQAEYSQAVTHAAGRIKSLMEDNVRLVAECDAATDRLNAKGMSVAPDIDMMRLLRQRDEARKECDAAREETREICATIAHKHNVYGTECAIRATPLGATPLAERIKELEAENLAFHEGEEDATYEQRLRAEKAESALANEKAALAATREERYLAGGRAERERLRAEAAESREAALRVALEENHPRVAAALAQAMRLEVSFVVRDSLTVALESMCAALAAVPAPKRERAAGPTLLSLRFAWWKGRDSAEMPIMEAAAKCEADLAAIVKGEKP